MDTIEERVCRAVRRELGLLRPRATDRLVEDYLVDSLDRVGLVLAVEEEFGVEVPDDDAEAWTTVGSITAYVTQRLDRPEAA